MGSFNVEPLHGRGSLGRRARDCDTRILVETLGRDEFRLTVISPELTGAALYRYTFHHLCAISQALLEDVSWPL